MSYQDFRLTEELMYMHWERLQRRTETRRMLRQAGLLQADWLQRHRCRLLSQLGRGLVALGKRLEQHALPGSVPVKGIDRKRRIMRGHACLPKAKLATWPVWELSRWPMPLESFSVMLDMVA